MCIFSLIINEISRITEYVQFKDCYVIIIEVFSGEKAYKKRFSDRSYE